MLNQRTKLKILIIVLAVLLLTAVGVLLFLNSIEFGFDRVVSDSEKAQRQKFVSTAEGWLDATEGSADHRRILEIYNTHQPLAQGYLVQPEDNWCATFVSAVAIQCEMTHIIPTECGCQRQIGLWEEMGQWVEDDSYTPLPGDIIYYATSNIDPFGDCTAWSDHVGIVVGTWGNYIKVIEGNNNNAVAYRYIRMDGATIRGYATPDYNKTAH